MSAQHVEAFRAWLLDAGYRPLTAGAYAGRITTIAAAELTHNTRYAARSYLGFIEHFGLEEEPEVVAALRRAAAPPEREDGGLGKLKTRRARQANKKRKLEARSFSDADWRKLVQAASRDTSPEGATVYVMLCTGLRISDILGLTLRALVDGLRSGTVLLDTKGGEARALPVEGAPEAWENLAANWKEARPNAFLGSTLLQLITPYASNDYYSGHPAYKAVAQKLHDLASEAGLEGQRVHLHRIRRTIAVQALRETGDVATVQQLLGHDSIQTTMRYLDEARTDDVGALQRKLAKRFTE